MQDKGRIWHVGSTGNSKFYKLHVDQFKVKISTADRVLLRNQGEKLSWMGYKENNHHENGLKIIYNLSLPKLVEVLWSL